MIYFSFDKDLLRYYRAWYRVKIAILRKNYHLISSTNLDIYGFYGCGKTEFARQLVAKHKDIRYFSFKGLDGKGALSAFCNSFLNGTHHETWKDALNALYDQFRIGFYLFLFDDVDAPSYEDFRLALKESEQPMNIQFRVTETIAPYFGRKTGYIEPRSVADFLNTFTALNKADVIRLYSLTGGIPAVAKEMDADLSYEDNLRILLSFDSAFSKTLPDILEKTFRSPESYHPIMNSIAVGHHRLSEIAKAVGFPNNKCGKYLDALSKAGLVKSEKPDNNPHTQYSLANSYLNSWYLYVYQNKNMQITDPQKLFDIVTASIDQSVAIPALHDSCIRYIRNDRHKDEYRVFDQYVKGINKPKKIKLRNGFHMQFDCALSHNDRILLGVFPRSLEEKYTKNELSHYIKVARSFGSLYDDVSLFVFSVNRFSDWCVHQASIFSQLFCVTAERLKY